MHPNNKVNIKKQKTYKIDVVDIRNLNKFYNTNISLTLLDHLHIYIFTYVYNFDQMDNYK